MREEPVVMKGTTFVGLDAHAKTIQVAILGPGSDKPVEFSSPTDGNSVRRLARKLRKHAGDGDLRCCYEAGPTGFALQRLLEAEGVSCSVVAPSLILRKPGERIKTDRRDAHKLAEQLRADMLTEVRPPTPEEESVRDLCRSREAAVEDRRRCRQRLGQFLLRRGLRWTGGKSAWGLQHRKWLQGLRFEYPVDQDVFANYVLAIEQAEDIVVRLEEALDTVAQGERYQERVGWLCCFRGVKTVTAMTILSELHGFERFTTPRELMGFLGLVPSEASTGERTSRGGITKTGNSHVRRNLIETAWHYRHRPFVGLALAKRRKGQPSWAVGIAQKAQLRLHARHRKLMGRGKNSNKVVVAIARELAGFIWAMLHRDAAATA